MSSGLPFVDMPKGPDSPFHAIVVGVETSSATASNAVGSATSATCTSWWSCSAGVMRVGAERIGRNQESYSPTVHAARELILASLG